MYLTKTYKDGCLDIIFDVFGKGFGLRPELPLTQTAMSWERYFQEPLKDVYVLSSASQSETGKE